MSQNFLKSILAQRNLSKHFEGFTSFDNTPPLSAQQKDFAVKAYGNGMKAWAIANQLNVPPTQLYDYLRKRPRSKTKFGKQTR